MGTMVDWSILPGDLLRCIGDCLLATSDIDYYMVMRAVCHNWRIATVDPQANGPASAVDPRFRPRRWVMLEEEQRHGDDDDDTRLFLNVSTGRFLRRRVPQLHGNILVASTSDGLLVLESKSDPHAARVLNPFTNTLLLFDAPMPLKGPAMAAVTDDNPTMLFVSDLDFEHFPDFQCAEPSTQSFFQQDPDGIFCVASMVAHAGDVYLASWWGEVRKTVGTVARCPNGELFAHTSDAVVVPGQRDKKSLDDDDNDNIYSDRIFLVDCSDSGEILLVRRTPQGIMDVFRVDMEKKDLMPVKNIGGRALFLGDRCLCVNANMLPSVDGNCIYYCNWFDNHNMYWHDLVDGKEEKISGKFVPGSKLYNDNTRPFSIVQLLLAYCNVLPEWDLRPPGSTWWFQNVAMNS